MFHPPVKLLSIPRLQKQVSGRAHGKPDFGLPLLSKPNRQGHAPQRNPPLNNGTRSPQILFKQSMRRVVGMERKMEKFTIASALTEHGLSIVRNAENAVSNGA
jgi:hypothetical protein